MKQFYNIVILATWQNSFEAFISDMGRRPFDGATIERKNNNGNYEPKNCEWATPRQQANNTRRNHWVTWDGITDTLAGWTRRLGLPERTLYKWASQGKDIPTMLTKRFGDAS